MPQKRLSEGLLHAPDGTLNEAGYATALVKEYKREHLRASRLRLKEWDYYCVVCDRFALALTVADNGYMWMDSVSLLDFERNRQTTCSRMRPLPAKRRDMPASSARGDIAVSGKDYAITFENDGTARRLHGHMDNFDQGRPVTFDVTLTDAPRDSMVIVTPFAGKKNAFYYNQKINCLRAEGTAACGDYAYTFDKKDSFAVLDWGRGVWTYDNVWFWGSASGLADGVPFGFNIGYGFGDTSAAGENMLFYDGAAHKLADVTFNIPQKNGREDYLAPWTFTSSDGRFTMDFAPIMDRSAKIDAKLLLSDQHQVFGRFTGQAILDDGTVLNVRNLTGFAEKVHNRW